LTNPTDLKQRSTTISTVRPMARLTDTIQALECYPSPSPSLDDVNFHSCLRYWIRVL